MDRVVGRGISTLEIGVDERGVRIPVAAALVAALAAAASAVAAPRVAPNPCKLVTAADVKAVLGTAVGSARLQKLGLYESCTYTTKSFVTVTVQTRPLGKADFVGSAKANPPPVKTVSGLGAPGYFAGGVTLLVWRHGNEATLSVFGSGLGSPLTREVLLAKRALARM